MSICDVYLDLNERRFSIRDIFYQTTRLLEEESKEKVSGVDIFKRPRRVNKFSIRRNYAKAGKTSRQMTFKINKKQFFDFAISISSSKTRAPLSSGKISSSSSRISFRTLINKFFIKFDSHQQTSDAAAYNKMPKQKNLPRFSRNPEWHCKLTCSPEVFLFRHWFFKFHPEKFGI